MVCGRPRATFQCRVARQNALMLKDLQHFTNPEEWKIPLRDLQGEGSSSTEITEFPLPSRGMGPPTKEYQIWSAGTISSHPLWICKGHSSFSVCIRALYRPCKIFYILSFCGCLGSQPHLWGIYWQTSGKPPYPRYKVSIGIAGLDTSRFYILSSNVVSASSCSRHAW